jgi:hypothetical protein
MIPPAIAGSIATTVIKVIYDRYKSIKKEKSYESVSEKLNTTKQIEVILNANESYRKEIRGDMARLRKEMDSLIENNKVQMSELKNNYEKEIESLQLQITKMNSELVLYREEHLQMRQLLSKEGIAFNSAISIQKGA